MPLLSIIVPVYNVELYLKDCIDSILSQTYRNFEIILVDDGSTDSSGIICDSYVTVDDRVRVIHKENSGLSSARNTGIELSSGDYIAFVDSDDFVDCEMYATLLEDMLKYDADMSVCAFRRVPENSIFDVNNKRADSESKTYIYNRADCARDILSNRDNVGVAAWNKVYKRSIFSTIRYPDGKIYEDTYIIADILSECNKVCVNTEIFYNYRIRGNSITERPYRDADKDFIVSINKLYDYYKSEYPQYLGQIEAQVCKVNFFILDKMVLSHKSINKEEIANIVSFLRKKIGFVLKRKEISKVRKVSAMALFVNFNLYVISVKLRKLLEHNK